MTNDQVSSLLWSAQRFWQKWKDNPPEYRDIKAWKSVIEEAYDIIRNYDSDIAKHIMQGFVDELNGRSRQRTESQK